MPIMLKKSENGLRFDRVIAEFSNPVTRRITNDVVGHLEHLSFVN